MCLTGTAEVPLAGMLLDQIIPEDQLPMRMVAFGHCFRAESGSAGAPCTLPLRITVLLHCDTSVRSRQCCGTPGAVLGHAHDLSFSAESCGKPILLYDAPFTQRSP